MNITSTNIYFITCNNNPHLKKFNRYIANFVTNNSYHLMDLICYYFTITVLLFHLSILMRIFLHFDINLWTSFKTI